MVAQAEVSTTSLARPPTRNSFTTAAAIRSGQIKISNPIPFPDTEDEDATASAPVPAAQIASPVGVGGQEPKTLIDIRPSQPALLNGSYDAWASARGRRAGPGINGTVATTITAGDQPIQHSRAGKSVEVLPTQIPIDPRNQHKRQSLRIKRNSPPESKRVSNALSSNALSSSIRESYGTSGDEEMKTGSKEKKRRSGSLRAVLRKVFGGGSKKEKGDRNSPSRKGAKSREIGDWMTEDNEQDAVTRSNTTHNMQYVSDLKPPIDPMKLPVHELTTKTPLGSHLPFPMNVNGPEPSPPHLSEHSSFAPLTFDADGNPPRVPRRRNTLPSLLLSPSDIKSLSEMWNKDLGDTAVGGDGNKRTTPTPDIGVAITSVGSLANKRRSRSADALAELSRQHAEANQVTDRKAVRHSRAEEIAYWRNSYAGGIQTQDFEHTRDSLPKRQNTESSTGTMRTAQPAQPVPDGGRYSMDDDDDDDDEEDSLMERRTPPNERASFEKPSPEDTRPSGTFDRVDHLGMRASAGHSRNFSRPVADSGEVERMREGLEDRLSKVENLVQRLEQSNNRRTIILENPPKGRRGLGDGSISSSDSNFGSQQRLGLPGQSHSQTNFAHHMGHGSQSRIDTTSPMTPVMPGNMHHPYHSPSATPAHSVTSHPYQQHNPFFHGGPQDFAASSSTQAPSLPSPNIYDYIAPLYAALRYERAKRKSFEVQMRQVQQQLNELHTLVRKESTISHHHANGNGYKEVQARGPAVYANSPETAFGSHSTMRFAPEDGTQGTRDQQSRFSGLGYDSSEDENDSGAGAAPRVGRFREHDTDSGAEKENYSPPKDNASVPATSKIPTPKQSTRSLKGSVKKQASTSSMGGQGSSSTGGTGASKGSKGSKGSMKNRFGFIGGKGGS